MNNNELYALDEALDYLNNDCAVTEFSISETLKNIIDKIKKSIIKLIDKCQEKLKTFKDSKVKSFLQNILSRLKALLTKSNNISSKEDADEISKEVSEIKEELDHPFSDEFIKAVKDGNVLKTHILIGDMLVIDYDLAIEMISYDIEENGIDKSNVTPEQIQEAEKEYKDKEDLLNYLLVLFKGDDGYSKRLITRIGKLL